MRIFLRAIQAKVETVQKIVQATVALHNYLRQTDTACYCPASFVDSFMAQEIFYQESCTESLQLMKGPVLFVAYPPIRGSRYRNYAMEVREALKAYVNSELSAFSWQWEYTVLELNF